MLRKHIVGVNAMDRANYPVGLTNQIGWMLWVVLLTATLGCGGGDSADSADASTKLSNAVAAATPTEAIGKFMAAFKEGDDATAESLLTEKARQEADRTQKAISPPGSKTMRFTVGAVEYVSEAKDAAHVACQILDFDPEGEESKYDVIWFLRHEDAGWRVAGVAMKVFEDELPVLYNFEDQDDMDRKMQLVEQEMIRRAQDTIMQAQQPAEGLRKQ
jgi:hypothetical protein